jgi:hypothetical protein
VTRPPATEPVGGPVDDTGPMRAVEPPEHGATAAGRAEPPDGRPVRRTRRSWRELAPYAVELLALLPLLWVLRRVMAAPLLSYQDYWDAFYRVTNPDGSPRWRGFFTYQNEHPFAVPSAVFYTAARIGDGDNRTLGYIVILVAALSVVLLRSLLPRAWSPMARAWMTVAISVIVFCPAGLWNFVRGMSGTAWLTANLFAIVAIAFAVRRRTVLALVAALLAVASYGTGFGALVAIALVAFVLRQGWWRILVPLGLLVVSGAVWVATSTSPGSTSGGGVSRDPALLSSTFLSNLGLLWAPVTTEAGTLFGAAGLVLLAVAFGVAWRRSAGAEDPRGTVLAELAPWWALAAYAVLAAALISLARAEAFSGIGVQSRYASLPALFWIALLVVTARVLLTTNVLASASAIAAVAVVFTAQSTPLSTQAVSEEPAQRLLATAVRLDAADSFGARFQRPNEIIPRLEALHDYPFDDQYSLGCGDLRPGDQVNVSNAPTVSTRAGRIDSDQLTVDSRYLRGWLVSTQPVDCVLLVDRAGTIVGGGAYGFVRPDVAATLHRAQQAVGWEAIAPSTAKDVRVIVGLDGGGFRTVTAPAS